MGRSITKKQLFVRNSTVSAGLSSPVGVSDGGTGITSYAIGDIIYASGTTTLSKLADVSAGQFLLSGGVTTAPAYSGTSLTYLSSVLTAPTLAATSTVNIGTDSSGGSPATGIMYFKNSGNTNYIGIQSGATSASYTLTLPTAQGGASTVLQNNGSGVLSWVTTSSGITVGTTTITSGTSLRIPYNLSGVYQEQANFTIGSVATGVLDVPVGYASRGVKFANQYDTGLQLTIGYLSGLGATMINNTFDANYAYNTLVGIGAGNAISGSFAGGNTALGYEALKATGGAGNPEVYNNTAVGFRALGTWGGGAGYNAALGYRAGYGTGSTLRYATFLGFQAGDSSAFNSVIAIGANATPTAANQCIIGATGAASGNGVIDNVYFNGVTHTSAANIAINAAGGSGTNNAGASLTLAGGKSTGSAAGGSLLFKTSTTLGSGTTLQSLATRLTISGGAVTTDASTATWADALDFVFGSTTGTKIGTSTSQKLAFYNSTPVVQQTTAVATSTFVANTSGIVDDSATFGGYKISQIVKALQVYGLLA